MSRALFAALLLACAGCAAPEAVETYELRLDYVWRGEVHTAVADYGLTLQECREARPELDGAYCVKEG